MLLQAKTQSNDCLDSIYKPGNAISGRLRGRDFSNFLYAPRQPMVALRLDRIRAGVFISGTEPRLATPVPSPSFSKFSPPFRNVWIRA